MANGGKTKYDIFICYRREYGAETAKHLRDILAEKGYRVFFDTDSLRGGNFNTALLEVIAKCNDFIIVLFPGTLDRCKNEHDWVRQELGCALSNGKNVIPIRGRGFHFPEELPADIEALRWKNGIDVNIEYFDAMIERLLGFLQSKPRRHRRLAITAGALATLIAVAAALYFTVLNGRFTGTRNADSQKEKTPIEGVIEASSDDDGQDESQNEGEEDPAYSAEYYILPESSTRYYTKDELEKLNDWELWMARNEIYARHGRKFNNKEAQDYFYSKPWYTGRFEPSEYDVKGVPKVYNDYESLNRAIIEQIEAERNSPYAD